jgi:hypothetical protein
MAAQDLIDTVNQGLDNVLPGRKIASVLARSYAEKAKKDINTAREESPKEFDNAMARESASMRGDIAGFKKYNKEYIRNRIGMKPEPEVLETPDRSIKMPFDTNSNTEYKKGGKVTASSRADGIAARGKTRGRII